MIIRLKNIVVLFYENINLHYFLFILARHYNKKHYSKTNLIKASLLRPRKCTKETKDHNVDVDGNKNQFKCFRVIYFTFK